MSAPATEEAVCPLCGAGGASPLYPLHDAVWAKPGLFGLVRCPGCTLAYLSPRPPRSSIGFYYQDLYDGSGLSFEEKLQHGSIAGFLNRRRLRDLTRRRSPHAGERHLDVGCGVGALLVRVARQTGASTVGVDFDGGAVGTARRRSAGLPVEVHKGTLAEVPLAPGFATVSMIHFLEHSYDPKGELALAASLLAPGGAIVVEVPSFDSFARRVFRAYWFPHLAPQHVTLFSRDTLVRALREAGFTDVKVRDVFAPMVWISSFVLWWHATLGGRSRYAKNPFVRAFTLLFALAFVIPMLFADLLLALVMPWVRHGDHIRATAMR